MKRVLAVCVCAGIVFGVMSCATGPEGKGNQAYEQSKKTQGDERRVLEKTAYMNYKISLTQNPDKISTQLRQRFVDLAVTRAYMILSEGGYTFDAVPLIQEEIEKYWAPDLPDEIKNNYAHFLVALCDSAFQHKGISEGLKKLDKAVEVSQDKAALGKARADRISGLVEQYLAMAQAELEQGKSNKDVEGTVRGEFYAKMVLELDSTNVAAQKVLSDARVENVSSYSLFKKVMPDYPDTLLYKKINKYDIFLAVAAKLSKGSNTVLEVTMWNYSYNPQRLKAESFRLEDDNGRKYAALASSKLQPEFLDFEIETKLTLVFPTPSGKIRKLVYENTPHLSEKFFF